MTPGGGGGGGGGQERDERDDNAQNRASSNVQILCSYSAGTLSGRVIPSWVLLACSSSSLASICCSRRASSLSACNMSSTASPGPVVVTS